MRGCYVAASSAAAFCSRVHPTVLVLLMNDIFGYFSSWKDNHD